MAIKIDPRELPAAADNMLYLDYIGMSLRQPFDTPVATQEVLRRAQDDTPGRLSIPSSVGSPCGELVESTAADFFTHSPLDFSTALDNRRGHAYPRQEISRLLAEYNAGLGAHARALANVEALSEPTTFCVIAGQQAGFLGGPAYTAYKIVTTIRLTVHLQEKLAGRFIPLFWLASEDHDLNEINHAYFFKRDGEVGKVKFRPAVSLSNPWDQAGHPVADLPITEDVRRAYAEYFESMLPGPYFSQAKERFASRPGEDFCTWQARIWSKLFSDRGLVIVEPRILRPPASDFFRFALEHSGEIERRLDAVARRLRAAGYTPSLASDQAGQLYTLDPSTGRRGEPVEPSGHRPSTSSTKLSRSGHRSTGRRVRVKDPRKHLAEAAAHPERYSTGAALRPLFADVMLPVAVSVLGPGEVAYHAMLKPLYDLFELPQPLLFPRKSYTIVSRREAERIAQYRTSVTAILTEQLDTEAVFRRLMPASEWAEAFASARRGLEEALSPLRPFVEEVDPSLGRTWAQTLANAARGLDKLEQKAVKARMSQLGFSRGELRALHNTLLPRNRLQERVFPLPHFINRHGMGFIDAIFSAGELDDFSHHVLTMEDGHARN